MTARFGLGQDDPRRGEKNEVIQIKRDWTIPYPFRSESRGFCWYYIIYASE